MKREIIAREQATGSIIALLEYLGSKAEKIGWTDRTTGRPMDAIVVTHNLMDQTGNVYRCGDREAGDSIQSADQYKQQYTKGTIVAVRVEMLIKEKGVLKLSGKLISIET